MSKDQKNIILGWLFSIELIVLFILFFMLFYILLGDRFRYVYAGFYFGLSLPVICVSIIIGGQTYLYKIFKKKKNT